MTMQARKINQSDGLNKLDPYLLQCNVQNHKISHSTHLTMLLQLVGKVRELILQYRNHSDNKGQHGIE
jgi:hypothetical protein